MAKRPSLKVCPFCGSSARYRNLRHEWETPMWMAACINECALSPEFDDKKDARDWWNRRYSGPAYGRPRQETPT